MPLCTNSVGPSVGRISHLPCRRVGKPVTRQLTIQRSGRRVAQHPGVANIDLANPAAGQSSANAPAVSFHVGKLRHGSSRAADRPDQRASTASQIGPRVAAFGQPPRYVADGETVCAQAPAVEFIPRQRCGHGRAAAGSDGVRSGRSLGVGVAHDVDVHPVAAVVLSCLDGAMGRIVGDGQFGHVARELAGGVEIGVTAQGRHNVQASGTGRLEVPGQAEVIEESSERAGSGSDYAEIVRRRIEVEHQSSG